MKGNERVEIFSHYNMQVGELKKQIQQNKLEHFYIFSGDEVKAQDIYIQKMSEVSKKPIKRIDTVAEIYSKTKSLFNNSTLYVVRDDKDFMRNEKAWTTLSDALGENILVFLLSDIDKRTKFYKHFADSITVFEHMNIKVLTKYIKKQIALSDTGCRKLAETCECDYSRILLEIDKIKQVQKITEESADSVLKSLLDNGTIHTPPQDAIFDFVDAVVCNNQQSAYELLEECKKIDEPALRLILVLYNTIRKVLQVQSCEYSKTAQIQSVTGLSAWDIKTVESKLNHWNTGDLVYFLRLFRDVEKGIKLGEIEDSVAMDYIMVNIW